MGLEGNQIGVGENKVILSYYQRQTWIILIRKQLETTARHQNRPRNQTNHIPLVEERLLIMLFVNIKLLFIIIIR